MTDEDWAGVADLVCQTLTRVYVERRERLEQEPQEMGAMLEQFAAMAIPQLVRKRVEP